MKLLDLLVKKTNEEGWSWPRGALGAHWIKSIKKVAFIDSDGYIPMHIIMHQFHDIDFDETETIVTKSQYESALAASEGWAGWLGGDCPVLANARVDVKQRDNWVSENSNANGWQWRHDGSYTDIIAYRLHKPDINSRANDDRLEQDLNECIGHGIDMPEWNSEGLPPVGCECEVMESNPRSAFNKFTPCKVIHFNLLEGIETQVCIIDDNGDFAILYGNDGVKFRPLLSEAEKAREKLASSLHIAAGASPIELNGIGPLYFKLADAIISGIVFGTTFKAGK